MYEVTLHCIVVQVWAISKYEQLSRKLMKACQSKMNWSICALSTSKISCSSHLGSTDCHRLSGTQVYIHTQSFQRHLYMFQTLDHNYGTHTDKDLYMQNVNDRK